MRKEKDGLGERLLPDEAYYGIQTLRAMENFAISDNTFAHYPNIVRAMAEIKKACALTNKEIGALPADIADAIATACDEVLAGRYPDQFPVNVFRGCGTSINMNVNEVLGNRANELLTGHKGADRVHPNTHVNMCQSSNDVFPTAASLVLYRETGGLLDALATLEAAVRERMEALGPVVRIGRTCLQDAVPLTFGQSLSGYASLLERTGTQIAAFRKRSATASSAPPPWARGSACSPASCAHLPQPVQHHRAPRAPESQPLRRDAKFRRRHDPVRARPQRGGGLRQDRPRLPAAVFLARSAASGNCGSAPASRTRTPSMYASSSSRSPIRSVQTTGR